MVRRAMASKAKRKPAARRGKGRRPAPRGRGKFTLRRVWIWLRRSVAALAGLVLIAVVAYAIFDPPTSHYIAAETRRLGSVDRQWVPLDEISPAMARAVVAAEDANFCLHWGFDMAAIRAAIAEGGERGASTITQQTVKNAYLWHGRSWLRKALEAGLTPLVELIWSKRRILEVYLNLAEFDEGVFGVEAAARHYFGVGPEALTARQAARLAAVLPAPKHRSAAQPSRETALRAAQIMDGAATIAADGRADCFED